MKTYVTYGLGNKFDISKLNIDLDCFVGKPKQAWWGSPIDAKFGWKEWCEAEDWIPGDVDPEIYFNDDNKILWTLEESSKILYLDTVYDLDTFVKLKYIVLDVYDEYDNYRCDLKILVNHYKWDFKKILDDGYTAIELTNGNIGHYFTSEVECLINGWDCESIVVLDPSKIIQI